LQPVISDVDIRHPGADHRDVARQPVIAYVFGTRPNFIKMAPVIERLRRRLPDARHVGVHTGQHYDREMSEVFFAELSVPAPDHLLGVGSGSHGAQTARALERLERVLLDDPPDIVIVPGDVNSTLAAALAAAKLGIPIAHIEAGLRSFDWSMPEEINRVLVDRLATWCFTHSPEARHHLLREGIPEHRVFEVGNTMIDSLVRMRARIDGSDVHRRMGIPAHGYLLVTLHRPALVDGPLLIEALAELDALSRRYPVVFPMHPRTRARASSFRRSGTSLHLIDPIGYVDFLALESRARAVITDSGGVQEETTFLGVPCFTLRDNTERPVTLTHGTNRLLGLRIDALRTIPDILHSTRSPRRPPAGWDGHAAGRIATVLAESLGACSEARPADMVAAI
jgi:UDP-N-acetylglucosamine 2-epimerase (non-hydrolysing)